VTTTERTDNLESYELEGKSLIVYAYVAKEGRPVGTRDVTRGANLSSPSVASRHLQKLESLGLIEKNAYGDYILKQKIAVNGNFWIGKNMVPRLIIYSFFFIGALIAEITTFLYIFLSGLEIQTNILYFTLLVLTITSMAIFLSEGISLSQKQKKC
jgi:hypothetical protein